MSIEGLDTEKYLNDNTGTDLNLSKINYNTLDISFVNLYDLDKLYIEDSKTNSQEIYEPIFAYLVNDNEKNEIYDLVGDDPDLVNFLNHIYGNVKKYFPNDDVKIMRDFEFSDNININVISKNSPDKTLIAYNNFKKDFLLKIDNDIWNRISLGIEQL